MELFRLLGTVAIDNSGANAAIDETTGKAEESHGKIGSAFGKIGSAAVAVGKTIAAGLAVGGAAVTALAKGALDGYADYEQLVGGVETLFGAGGQSIEEYAKSVGKTVSEVKDEYKSLMTAQETVLKNADAAYQTAGMSANEYMETVTSFSASLIQSLDGDTEAAAAKANQAIVDMSDNANKMGSDIASIQNAYQGFAKQNYTMLDNLKLGYGGTKEEMARLLRDAEAISGIKYDISSYADVVDAIHVIQEEMGIAGTTAKEASATISGSVSAAKSAWQNFVAGLGNEDADIGALLDQLSESVLTAADNIIPRIEVILGKIVEVIPKIAPKITKVLPKLINSLLPAIITAAVALIGSVADALPDILGALFSEDVLGLFLDGVMQIFVAIVEALPTLIEMLTSALPMLIEAITAALPGLISALVDSNIIAALIDCALQLTLALIEALPTLIQLIVEQLPTILMQIANGLTAAFPVLLDSVTQLFGQIWTMIANGLFGTETTFEESFGVIEDIFGEVWEVLKNIWEQAGVPMWEAIQSIIETVKGVFSEKMPEIKEFVSGCFEDIEEFWNNHLKPCFDAISKFIGETLAPAFEEVFNNFIGPAVDTCFEGIKSLWEDTLKPVFTGIVDFITDVFTGDWGGAWQALVDIVVGIFDGLVNAIKTPINLCIDAVNAFIEGLNKLEIPDWVPGVGGKGINIPLIPKLEKGGILEKGQVGFLEGNGAEAVVPLDQNEKWIGRVAQDMAMQGIGGGIDYDRLSVAVVAAIREVLPDLQNTQRIEADESGIFRVVRDRAREYTQKTGNPAFV